LAQIYWNDSQTADHNKHIVPLALRKPALFNALMAKSLMHFQTADRPVPLGQDPSDRNKEMKAMMIDIVFFKMQTLKGLRSALELGSANQTCPSIIMTIIFLLKMEVSGRLWTLYLCLY
jgi:hypothetical protein